MQDVGLGGLLRLLIMVVPIVGYVADPVGQTVQMRHLMKLGTNGGGLIRVISSFPLDKQIVINQTFMKSSIQIIELTPCLYLPVDLPTWV